MRYLYYDRSGCDSYEKCKCPSGSEVESPKIEIAFDADQEFMIDFISEFRALTGRSLVISAIFNKPDSGPTGENSYINIEINSESEWELAFNTIDQIVNNHSDILIEYY